MAQLRRLAITLVVEATTLLLLVGVAVPLKHLGGWPLGVQVMGPMHGVAFVAYIWTALQTVAGAHWRRGEVVRLFAGAFIPLGGLFNMSFLAGKAAALRDGERA